MNPSSVLSREVAVILRVCFGLPCCVQGQLREAIRDMVLRCPQTLFIFDEAEKLHPGLIDAIKPYMDHYDNVDGVSYRTAIFLFLRLVFYIKHIQFI